MPRNWDASPIGGSLIGVVDTDEYEPQIRVVLNWFEELRQRAPSK